MAGFTSETAKRLHERHHKPPPESTFVTAARKSLDRMPAGRARQAMFDGLAQRAPTDADAEWLARWSLEANEAAARAEDEAVAAEMAEGLAVAEAVAQAAAAEAAKADHAPYLGDDGRLRASDGNVLGTADAVEALQALARVDHAAANELATHVDDATWDALQAAAAEAGQTQEHTP